MNYTEPAWAKNITEENLPTEELKYLASIIGLEATKKLMVQAPGWIFPIPKKCTLQYKKQYIIENYDGTKEAMFKLTRECDVCERFVYKVIKEHVEGKTNKR